MIEVRNLSKSYGPTRAVDDLSFAVKPGAVTGILGPNGAGKSTTMRTVLGLDRPSAGTATIGGKHFPQLQQPLRAVGALLDAQWLHPNRSARAHLRWMAAANRIPVPGWRRSSPWSGSPRWPANARAPSPSACPSVSVSPAPLSTMPTQATKPEQRSQSNEAVGQGWVVTFCTALVYTSVTTAGSRGAPEGPPLASTLTRVPLVSAR